MTVMMPIELKPSTDCSSIATPVRPPVLIWFGSRNKSKPSANTTLPKTIKAMLRSACRMSVCFNLLPPLLQFHR